MKIRLGTFNLFQFVEPPYSWYTKKEKFNERQWTEKTTWIKNQILRDKHNTERDKRPAFGICDDHEGRDIEGP